jgi:hypothetical protein
LSKIKAAIEVNSQFGASSKHGGRTNARQNDILLDIISDYMSRKGVDMSAPFVLSGGRHYSTFKNKSVAVYEYVKPVGARNEQRALLRIGVSLLYADLERMGLAITSRLLMAHVHRIPAVINRAFPGYRKIGALKLILVKRKHSGKETI